MNTRGLRLLKALESYSKARPNQFDTGVILNKVNLQSISNGTSLTTFKVDRSMCNGGEFLHGGFIAACVDALATFAHLGTTGKIAWTMNLHVDFISTAALGEEITLVTSVIRPGSLPLIEARLTKADGRLVARGVAAMLNGSDKFQGLVKDVYGFEPGDE